MSDALPAPLVPAEVDLRDFAFMPLDVLRLRDSDLASSETPEACWAAVLLWCASWHQVPAASIPDDDRWIAKQAGYAQRGKIAREWTDVRIGALRHWVKCSDGRLYHPVVAEKAVDAWRGKMRQRWGAECARIKKHNQRHSVSLECPPFDEWLSLGCPQGQSLPVPPKVPGDVLGTQQIVPGDTIQKDRDVPRETPSKGQREGQGQGQGQIDSSSSLRSEDRPPGPPGSVNGHPHPSPPNGTRIAADWQPDIDDIAFAQAEGLTRQALERTAASFRDYWLAKPGADGRKRDWSATWRNWVRKEGERRSATPTDPGRPTRGVASALAGLDAYDRKLHGEDR